MLNARASFNRAVKAWADGEPTATGAVFEADEEWPALPAARAEWTAAGMPRGVARWAQAVRVHVRAESSYDAEAMLARLETALGLGNNQTLCILREYDYASNATNPPAIGNLIVERSPRGIDRLPPAAGNPTHRGLALNLVVVYQQR